MCERRPACHQMFVALLANKKQQHVMAKESTYITGNALKKFLLKKGFGLVTSLPSFPGAYLQQIVVRKLSAMVLKLTPCRHDNLGPYEKGPRISAIKTGEEELPIMNVMHWCLRGSSR